MGKFIVIEVDKDDVASKLAERFADKPGLRLVGMFNRPRGHCTHAAMTGGYRPDKGTFVRGSKFGWWLHNVPGCGRPRRGSHQLENLIKPQDYPLLEGSTYTQKVATLHIFDVLTERMVRGDDEPA